jgi:hypothetical protein
MLGAEIGPLRLFYASEEIPGVGRPPGGAQDVAQIRAHVPFVGREPIRFPVFEQVESRAERTLSGVELCHVVVDAPQDLPNSTNCGVAR